MCRRIMIDPDFNEPPSLGFRTFNPHGNQMNLATCYGAVTTVIMKRMITDSDIFSCCRILLVALVACTVTACDFLPDKIGVYTPVIELKFADSRLKDCVADVAEKNNWTQAGMVTTLTCTNPQSKRIQHLDGIELLVHLERLDLAHNDISDTGPLNSLEHLQHIDLSYNALKQINIAPGSHILAINVLNLSHNQIEHLDWAAKLARLERLSISHNRLTSLSPLSGLRNLTYLNVSGNRVQSLQPLSRLGQLSVLNASRNQISDVSSLAGKESMTALILASNQITDIAPLIGNNQLNRLNLADNPLTDVDGIQSLHGLANLDLASTQLESIDPIFGLGALEHVSLDNNPAISCQALMRLKSAVGNDVVDTDQSCI